ncbi:MAG: hypothetical protein CSA75_05440 [Sorangium cellulosum]|nr:MAG: hypothetical protein CSA75_05440 [Sorangium cellulosum]
MVVHDQEGRYPHKVRVRNPVGRIAEAVVWVEVGPPQEADAGIDVFDPDAGEKDGNVGLADTSTAPAQAADWVGIEGGGCGCSVQRQENGSSNNLAGAILSLFSALWLARRCRWFSHLR